MRIYGIVFLILALCLGVRAEDENTIAEVLQRAKGAPADRQTDLYLKAAEMQLKAADHLYDSGKPDEANQQISGLVSSAEEASKAAGTSGKRLKKTEINLRKMATKLRDIKRGLSYADQAPVQIAIDRLEAMRTDLLQRMFGKGKS